MVRFREALPFLMLGFKLFTKETPPNLMEILILQTNCRILFRQACNPNKVQKMRISHSPKSSLSAKFLLASVNVVCLNSSKMFLIVRLLSDEVNVQF